MYVDGQIYDVVAVTFTQNSFASIGGYPHLTALATLY